MSEKAVLENLRRGLVDGIPTAEQRRRTRSGLAIACLLAVLGVAGWTTTFRSASEEVVAVATTSEPNRFLNEVGAVPGRELSEGLFLTDHGVLAWGIFDGFSVVESDYVAGILDHREAQWRAISPPPGSVDSMTAVDWTGEELIVCCGPESSGEGTAWAYDPDFDSWRLLPAPPAVGSASGDWVDGSLLIVTSTGDAAAYDPLAEQWSELALPLSRSTRYATGSDGRWWGVWPSPGSRTVGTGAVYDSVSDAWTELPSPEPELWPASPSLAISDGHVLLAGGLPGRSEGDPEDLVVLSLDLSGTLEWNQIRVGLPAPQSCECNIGSHQMIATGEVAVLWIGALASGESSIGLELVFQQQDGTWQVVQKSETLWMPVDGQPGELLQSDGVELRLTALPLN